VYIAFTGKVLYIHAEFDELDEYGDGMDWSWILAALGVTGIFFVGKKTIFGWFILLANECLWITYAIVTQQYGFIAAAIAYSIVYTKSALSWHRETSNG
jgi:hypothetical protein